MLSHNLVSVMFHHLRIKPSPTDSHSPFVTQTSFLSRTNPLCALRHSVSSLGDDMQKAREIQNFLIFGYMNLQHFS